MRCWGLPSAIVKDFWIHAMLSVDLRRRGRLPKHAMIVDLNNCGDFWCMRCWERWQLTSSLEISANLNNCGELIYLLELRIRWRAIWLLHQRSADESAKSMRCWGLPSAIVLRLLNPCDNGWSQQLWGDSEIMRRWECCSQSLWGDSQSMRCWGLPSAIVKGFWCMRC